MVQSHAGQIARYAVFGYPIGHSLSPVMHNAAFRERGIAARYEAWEVRPGELAAALEAFRARDGRGCNITRPLKTEAFRLAGRRQPWAERTGAVNTLYWEGTELAGANTDAEALSALCPPAGPGEAALVVGAGGVGRATVAVLEGLGYLVTVAARHPEGVVWHPRVVPWEAKGEGRWRVVVNASPLGQEGEPPWDSLPALEPGYSVAVDWVYRPRLTPFLAAARQRGCGVVDGLTLLVEQAALAWRYWFGQEGPRAVMLTAAAQVEPA
ncbi:Shikimate 5-dehydrogenase I alpha [Candidatus Hydrogenisulfobacillus filiaventi]|uniref:Shikimate 5-dehydrogenase I alpha n=1 Tax=Candidatus Hydrogenisulfobacillus filiaventi TaxID=2707344 RepID=A0A6F8ZGP8_9FIRM|nr:shikimate dehydrogenase [Bacillota bacterium]CAB1128930.1 Shikimate 5-dehydrogenase I alpha [Candidatus Hydrogenisulfobacillus filiaventi]